MVNRLKHCIHRNIIPKRILRKRKYVCIDCTSFYHLFQAIARVSSPAQCSASVGQGSPLFVLCPPKDPLQNCALRLLVSFCVSLVSVNSSPLKFMFRILGLWTVGSGDALLAPDCSVRSLVSGDSPRLCFSLPAFQVLCLLCWVVGSFWPVS